jgi:hypothetical protein
MGNKWVSTIKTNKNIAPTHSPKSNKAIKISMKWNFFEECLNSKINPEVTKNPFKHGGR